MNRSRTIILFCLLVLALAPACSPNEPPPPPPRPVHVVLLADTTAWPPGRLARLRATRPPGQRLLVTGFPGETTTELLARLPWLLQPGVDTFLYDTMSLGPTGADSVRTFLREWGTPVPVTAITPVARR